MTQLMKIVLVLSLSGTALAAFLALLRRWLKNRLPHWLFYYLWLLVLLRLLIPVALPVPGLELTLPEPRPVEAVTPPSGERTPPNPEQATVPFDPTYVQTVPSPSVITGTGLELSFQQEKTPWYERVWDFLCTHFLPIWLAGAVIHFLWFALSYLRFCRSLRADCVPLWEHEQALLDGLRGKLQVEACRSPLAGTPMLVGLIRPRIILSETAITTLQLECILRHELTHLRRRDLLYKWFAVAVTSFHWFNPLMPWLRKELDRCCELSCDEAVIGSMNEDWKRTYGETLLALAAQSALPRAVPATTLCEEKQQLKERLVGILKHRHATALILALSCLLALLVAGCAAVLGPSVRKSDLPQAADYALWIQSPQQETFVRNWKAEYHDGTEVTSVHFAPEDYSGDDYVFRGRELPELRARVEAWAFAELPLDRENCILYYQMEPELLPAASSLVTEFPLDGGEPTQTEVFQLDMSTYCGHVTVTDLRDNSLWLVVLTDNARVPQAKPTEPADPDPVAVPDLAGKIFVYEKEGFGSDFTIKLHADGTLGYYEGMLSSHIGMGTWDVEGDILTLHEDTFDRTFRFRVQDGALHFLREGSDQFTYIKVADGARFLENVQATATLQAFSQVLWNAYLKGELPQGENLDWRSVEEAAENHFTCTDIDGDGRVELLISWTSASMAGHDFVIFDYHDGALYRTDLPFTSLRFYDNGAVEVDWSHSQGWSGRFWPYDVYFYNAETDDYAALGSVEAWDKQLVSKGFPDDVDADGDGLVYEVRRAGEVLPNDRHYDRRRLMDGPAFEEWRQSYLNGAQEVEIELIPLTEENIAALGAPKPVVHAVQPVG